MHPSAVRPREELCSRQQCRPRRRHLDRGRPGKKQSSPKRAAPAASGSGTDSKTPFILSPSNGGANCQARQSALTVCDPVFGPCCGGSVRGRSFAPSFWPALRGGVFGSKSALTHASERSKPARGTLLAAAVQAATKTFGQRTSQREKSSPKRTAPAASGSGTDSKRPPFCRPTTAAQTVKPDSRP